MLFQIDAAASHPLAGTIAEYVWLLPLLPLLGFVINGLLSVVAVARTGPANPDTGLAVDGHGHAVVGHGQAHATDAHAHGTHGAHGDVAHHDAAHGASGGAVGDDHHP